MPELNWVGKDKVITHHLDVPYRVLDRQYSYDEHGQHDADNGSQNMILPITQVTKAGSTKTPSTTRELRNGLVKSLARKAKTSRATTNGYA